MLVGYCLVLQPRQARRFCYVLVAGGIGASLVILLFFHSKAASLSSGDSLNRLRAVAYVSNYAGLAASLLLFSAVARMRLFPLWLTIGIGGFCIVGQFATLSRSDWLATVAGIAGMYALLPNLRTGGRIFALLDRAAPGPAVPLVRPVAGFHGGGATSNSR